MIVCKITLSDESSLSGKLLESFEKIGDFMLTKQKEIEFYFSSIQLDINEEYVRKILKKNKVDFLIHVYKFGETLDYSSLVNQWVAENLDRQNLLQTELDMQPELQKIQKRIELADRLVTELIAAKEKIEAEKASENK